MTPDDGSSPLKWPADFPGKHSRLTEGENDMDLIVKILRAVADVIEQDEGERKQRVERQSGGSGRPPTGGGG